MRGLLKRESKAVEPIDVFDPFDRMWEMLPFRRPMFLEREWMPADAIRVDEYREDGAFVIRAELPGIDPDKDIELTVSDGMLHIAAERREEEEVEDKGYLRHELHYGSFSRSLPLPEGVSESDITATYSDGILEVRIPAPAPTPAAKIAITKT